MGWGQGLPWRLRWMGDGLKNCDVGESADTELKKIGGLER